MSNSILHYFCLLLHITAPDTQVCHVELYVLIELMIITQYTQVIACVRFMLISSVFIRSTICFLHYSVSNLYFILCFI
jgi:hypothetical protein